MKALALSLNFEIEADRCVYATFWIMDFEFQKITERSNKLF